MIFYPLSRYLFFFFFKKKNFGDPQPRKKPIADHECEQRLGILDPAVFRHAHGLFPWDDDGLEFLIELVIGRPRPEILAEVEVHPLVHDPRTDIPIPDAANPPGVVAGLFQEFPLRGLVGRLPGVDRPGGHLEQRPIDRIASIPDQADVPLVDPVGTSATAPAWRTTSRSAIVPSRSPTCYKAQVSSRRARKMIRRVISGSAMVLSEALSAPLRCAKDKRAHPPLILAAYSTVQLFFRIVASNRDSWLGRSIFVGLSQMPMIVTSLHCRTIVLGLTPQATARRPSEASGTNVASACRELALRDPRSNGRDSPTHASDKNDFDTPLAGFESATGTKETSIEPRTIGAEADATHGEPIPPMKSEIEESTLMLRRPSTAGTPGVETTLSMAEATRSFEDMEASEAETTG